MNSANQSSFNTRVLPIRQSGVVLVMALVMLAVLTLVGVASMSSSTLEMKVAGNMQQHNIAFQAAQSRLAFAGSEDPGVPASGDVAAIPSANPINYLINIDVQADPSEWPVQDCNVEDGCPNGDGWVATAEVSYLACGKGFGSSLESGKGFSFRMFEIVAVGETATRSAKSVQASTLRFPVKGCGDEML